MNNNFIDLRFPTEISFGSSGGPEFYTGIVSTSSGYEQRNINWSIARAKYNVACGIQHRSQLDKVIAFFRACKGKALAFRFKDWNDYQAQDQNIGVGDAQCKLFRLIKSYNIGKRQEIRKITKPVHNTVTVCVDGVDVTRTIQVDYSNGIIHFKYPPKQGQNITASFEFDTPVRFDTDHLNISAHSYELSTLHSIPLIEVKL